MDEKMIHKHASTNEYHDAIWDTPYGQVNFKKDSGSWRGMVIRQDKGPIFEYQQSIMNDLMELQLKIVTHDGKSPMITIS